MTDQRFTLRVAVKTFSEKPIAGLEEGSGFDVGSVRVSIDQRGRYLVLKAGAFANSTNAEQFLPHLEAGLWNLALEYSIAFIPDFVQRKVIRTADPEVMGRNLAATFGVTTLGPVHGLADEGGTVIFPSNENIWLIGMGEVTLHVSPSVNGVIPVLVEGIEHADLTGTMNDTFSTAIDLYLANFYERSIRARFLTLMMALEVLAPVTKKHAVAQEFLIRWKGEIQEQISKVDDEEARDALVALDRELQFRKETSIRRRVRQLVIDAVSPDYPNKTDLVRRVVDAYDLRGKLVHPDSTDSVDENRLSESYDVILGVIKLILRSRMGLAPRLSNSR